MPTPDASQFTQLKKYAAISARRDDNQSQQKTLTHLYQPVPSVTRPRDFLASFSNKYAQPPKFTPINRVTGFESKPKVPGGNTNGNGGIIKRTARFAIYTYGDPLPVLPLGGPFGTIVIRLTGVAPSTSVVFTFDTSSVLGYNLSSVASYAPLLGTKIQSVAFGADTVTIITDGTSTTGDIHTATIDILSNNFNFELLSIL